MTQACDLPIEDLVAYAGGELRAARKEIVEAHLQFCPECRKQVVAFSEVDKVLRDAIPLVDDPAGWAEIKARLEWEASQRSHWRPLRVLKGEIMRGIMQLREKAVMIAALIIVSMMSFAAGAVASNESPPPPWVLPNGTIDVSKLPECIPVAGPDGEPAVDEQGELICIPTEQLFAPPPDVGPAGPGLNPPGFAPSDIMGRGYIEQPPEATISAPDGRPVAQLADPPAELAQSVAVDLNKAGTGDGSGVSFEVLAKVRYEGSGHTVIVFTTQPSPAALRAARSGEIAIGEQQVQLSDGSTAWITTDTPHDTPNRVVFERDGLLITVTGDLPVDDLITLAERIVIVR
jgi:hypothetical protein